MNNSSKSAEVRSKELALGARAYYEAALAADERIGYLPGYEVPAPPPVMMLAAHRIELSMQSKRVLPGVSEEEPRKKRSWHDLTALWDRFQKASNGLPSPPEIDLDLLRNISAGHDGLVFRDKSFDKRKKYSGAEGPVFGPFSALAVTLLEMCDAPLLEDFT